MFGGRITAFTYVQELWSYDGTTWSNRGVTGAPTARGNAGFAFDPVRNEAILFGGMSGPTTFQSNTVRWTGVTWLPFLGSSPAARAGHTLVWDGRGRRILTCGGESVSQSRRADTSVYTYNPLASVGQIANSGCAGASGTVPAQITGFGPPAIGNTSFALDFYTPSPPTAAPVAFMLSANQSNLMLGPCRIVVDPAALIAVSNRMQRGSLATMPLPIPAAVHLLGLTCFAQCAYFDPPTGLSGLAVSFGAQVTVGDF